MVRNQIHYVNLIWLQRNFRWLLLDRNVANVTVITQVYLVCLISLQIRFSILSSMIIEACKFWECVD